MSVNTERKYGDLRKNVFALSTENVKSENQRLNNIKTKNLLPPRAAMVIHLISEKDPNLQIKEDDFSPEMDSTVLIRE